MEVIQTGVISLCSNIICVKNSVFPEEQLYGYKSHLISRKLQHFVNCLEKLTTQQIFTVCVLVTGTTLNLVAQIL